MPCRSRMSLTVCMDVLYCPMQKLGHDHSPSVAISSVSHNSLLLLLVHHESAFGSCAQ